MKRILLLLLYLQPALALAAPRVVTSIAPLQEIAGALMAGIAEPQVIIENQASAHHFAFKPSHMRRLQQADLVVWIDSQFEPGFNRIAQTLPAATRTLELLPALGIESEDGHIWYSPALLHYPGGNADRTRPGKPGALPGKRAATVSGRGGLGRTYARTLARQQTQAANRSRIPGALRA
jgi:hypothetical protein